MLEKTKEYLNKRLDELYLIRNMASVTGEIYELENIIKEVNEYEQLVVALNNEIVALSEGDDDLF